MADKAEKKSEAAPAGDKKDAGAKPAGGDAHKDAASGGGGGGGGLLAKTPVLLGGVMLIEAVVLFAGFKFLAGGNPAPAAGAEIAAEEKSESHEEPAKEAEGHGAAKESAEHGGSEKSSKAIDKKKAVEVRVIEFKAPNKMTGRTFIYDIKICVLTKGEFLSRVEDTIKEREALIQDRIRTIVAQSDPEKLGGASEPGLETLRRQVKYQLDEIIGEGMIDEVLVPRCIPLRTDY